MQIVVTGLNHKSAPLEIRERVTVKPEAIPDALRCLAEFPRVREAVILSTCNRTEIYVRINLPKDLSRVNAKTCRDAEATDSSVVGQIQQYIAELGQLDLKSLTPHMYTFYGLEAVLHLFSVACGLDSLVPGEAQILSQVKEAYLIATKSGAVKNVLHKLFVQAIRAGRRARAEIDLGGNTVSVSHAAVELSIKLVGELEGKTVMVLGAGEMARLALKCFIEKGVATVIIANRTFSTAESVAASLRELYEVSAIPIHIAKAHLWLSEVDVVLNSADATGRFLNEEMVANAMKHRHERPLHIIDIAVPRSVDPGVSTVEGVTLSNIDDIQEVVGQIVGQHLKEPEGELSKIKRIIEEEANRFEKWMGNFRVAPVARMLREGADDIIKSELRWAFNKLPAAAEREKRIIEAVVHRTVNKLLNGPFVTLKRLGQLVELREDGAGDPPDEFSEARMEEEERIECADHEAKLTGHSKYYPALIDLEGKKCLVVGGGNVAARKVSSLLRSGARVTVISPQINPLLRVEAELGMVTWVPREYEPGDARGFFLVIAASSSKSVNRAVADEARNGLVDVVDSPRDSTFIVPSAIRRGDLIIAISTLGKSPALASRIREELEGSYPEEFGMLVDYLSEVRKALKGVVQDHNTRKEILRRIVDSDLLDLVRSAKYEEAGSLIDKLLMEYGVKLPVFMGKMRVEQRP